MIAVRFLSESTFPFSEWKEHWVFKRSERVGSVVSMSSQKQTPVLPAKVLVGRAQPLLAWWPFLWVSSIAVLWQRTIPFKCYMHTLLLLLGPKGLFAHEIRWCVWRKYVPWQLKWSEFLFRPCSFIAERCGLVPVPHLVLDTGDGNPRIVFAPSRNHMECDNVNELLSRMSWYYIVKHNSKKGGLFS